MPHFNKNNKNIETYDKLGYKSAWDMYLTIKFLKQVDLLRMLEYLQSIETDLDRSIGYMKAIEILKNNLLKLIDKEISEVETTRLNLSNSPNLMPSDVL